MIRCHHAGKMGDLIFALPVFRALRRIHGQPIHLTTSGLCWQLVPLLWEQPYFADVVLDDTRPYGIPFETGVTTNWEYYTREEGLNLSLQPKHQDQDCPISWTRSYAWLAGLDPWTCFEPADLVSLPTLVNHRNWHYGIDVRLDGQEQALPRIIVVAPEVETLESASEETWTRVMDRLMDDGYTVVLVGTQPTPDYTVHLHAWRHVPPVLFRDLRGLTTVPVLAKLIAEATAFIGAHSLPWHLARLAGTPAVCLQHWREGLRRCLPIDTPAERCPWVEPDRWAAAVNWIRVQDPLVTGGPT